MKKSEYLKIIEQNKKMTKSIQDMILILEHPNNIDQDNFNIIIDAWILSAKNLVEITTKTGLDVQYKN